MNKLTHLYQDLSEIHDQLDNLIKIAYFKLYRRENSLELDMAPEHSVKRYNEDEYDLMAYTNAINLKFQLYCHSAFKYFKLYAQEVLSTSFAPSSTLIEQLFKSTLITAQEYKKLAKLTGYIKQIAKPDAHGNYEYTDDIIEYYHTLNKILLNLNPEIPMQPYSASTGIASSPFRT